MHILGYTTCFIFGGWATSTFVFGGSSCKGCLLCVWISDQNPDSCRFPTFSAGTGFGTSSATLRAMPDAVKKAPFVDLMLDVKGGRVEMLWGCCVDPFSERRGKSHL